ncbi:MAG: right-handed parallel beta-helix repeat-containing protein, partial [Clostridia bacterium]|nr:right-handed parallel beta-helix repeat-containing protein [Clostridia bacterium]
MFDLTRFQTADGYKIPSGVHYVTDPVAITGKNIRIVGEDGAILRGTMRLTRKDFTEETPGVWTASVPCKADAFYVGDRKYVMARYPKANRPGDVFDGYAADCILPVKTAGWADPTGGYVHAMHKHDWGGYTYRIDGKNDDGTLALSGGWQNNRQMGMHNEYRYAENILEEMTEQGEWYFDEKNNKLYVRLCDGDDLDQAEVAVARGFFVLENCENVTIENITFERSVRTFMDTIEPLLRSDWTIYRGGAILVRNSTDCTVDRCAFYNVGSNGVFVDGDNENIRISRTHFRKIGASAICFVGRSDCVRSPLFEYNETQSVHDFDKEPGPKSNNYPKNSMVEDCLIEYVGTVEKQATGIQISMSYGITMRNCTVCHTSRSGINISEGTFGGHRIEGCDVFDTVRETGDHGSFNSWGRDRYWHVPDLDDHDAWKYARLDTLGPTVITRSRFRCDRGWDIDLDDGSTDYVITENLCLNGGIKLREGFFRTVRNNIAVNNTLHTHAWYPTSGDVAENNIFCTGYLPYAMPEVWGKSINANIFHTPGQTTPTHAAKLAAVSGQDSESICLDVGFANPAACDFTPTNPLIHGFENFPTEFGVRYAPLRAIADTPELPIVQEAAESAESVQKTVNGITVKNIENDGEMSYYGSAGYRGAIVLSVAEGTPAEKRGLAVNDVIVG